jgi:hypothetical protein
MPSKGEAFFLYIRTEKTLRLCIFSSSLPLYYNNILLDETMDTPLSTRLKNVIIFAELTN